MKPTHLLTAFALVAFSVIQAQTPAKKPSLLSLTISLSDYRFPAMVKSSSLNKAFQSKDWYKPGNKSFGIGMSYWKGLAKRIDFSTTLTGTFSNFPAYFVKDDSIGQAKFSAQLDALLHLKMFTDKASVNPFITAGAGAGYFPGNFAVYAPLGAGLHFRFKEGTFMTLQAQWRKKLTDGITNDYLFYSLGFMQSNLLGRKKHTTADNEIKPVMVADKDGDGTEDAKDECPDVWGTLNGCPDTDRDGVADKNDPCPDVKGTINGCPDTDGDGVADNEDQCPDLKGTVHGCPDADGDGVTDKEDACKDVAGVAKYKGCPVPDTDGDGINDEDDKCPGVSGTAANGGCPEIKKEEQEKINYAAKHIYFAFASNIIQKVSFKPLDEAVAILKQHPELKLSIGAHADNRGTPERNMYWSERRAKAVADYFISKGISSERITYKGYGDTQPVADNKTETGRAKNRRVELKVSY